MLVIGRKESEEIVIGDPRSPLGVIRIVAIRGNCVRVGLDFARDVPVNRREKADELAKETGETRG